MSKKKSKKHLPWPAEETAPRKKFNFKLLGILALNTVLLFGIYRVCMSLPYFEIVLGIYIAVTAALALGYVIYNRGFSRKGITFEMLPDTMSEQQKREFIEDGAAREKKSKWMLTLLIPLIFVFMFELIELYMLPFLQSFGQ